MNAVSEPSTPDSGGSESYTKLYTVNDDRSVMQLLGPGSAVLPSLEAQYPGITITVRGHDIRLSGPKDQVKAAYRLLEMSDQLAADGQEVRDDNLVSSRRMLEETSQTAGGVNLGEVILSSRGKTIRPKTLGQKKYVEAISENTVVFGIGPAGTGKTYLAMAKAVQALQQKQVARIILTRPAVEAGERLGYLPGTLTDKIDPYLRPLFDAINEMMDPELVTKLIGLGTIEVAPLAYMRGRTLNDSFIILDEAQNTTEEQMKMFLTRLGFGSQMVVTGDITQIDLPGGTSGLRQVKKILDGVDDIHFAELSSKDVVRHSLVARIVDAYSRHDENKAAPESRQRRGRVIPVTSQGEAGRA